ncbi:MAG: lamin tail domain-containing protein [Paludibacter sp.]
MKKSGLIFMIFLPFFCLGQVNDRFTDGDFTTLPAWTGITTNFQVNTSGQLQSKATTSSTSYLFTPSEAFDNATWECWVKINYNSTVYNYVSIYIASDRNELSTGCYGYFVQIGGTNKDITLWLQEGTKKTKIIDGTDKRTDRSPCELKIKVTRDSLGKFTLFSKLASETDYTQEGITVQNNIVKMSSYFGLLYVNSSATGSYFYFDDILVTGNKALDKENPIWTTFTLEQPNKLNLGFSEAMDYSNAAFSVDREMGVPSSQSIATDKRSVSLSFSKNFERGKIYHLQVSGLTDLAGNQLAETTRSIGISEFISPGDLIFNEVMFENPDSSAEYIEIYNRSDKLLDVSGLVFTNRKTDGSLNSGNKIPDKTQLLPQSFLAMTSDANKVRKYHNCPPESNIISTEWSTLNNESTTLVLCNSTKDTIYDELTYNTNWHHVLVKNPKGVALERINPDLPTQDKNSWHSAASEVNYGTPGYKNSQFREIEVVAKDPKFVWTDPEAFSPDNDGVDDVCFIRYKTETSGYVANAIIFNAVGVKIYQLASNVLLANEGFLTWDGKTDAGKNANVGVYVLYFEMFNPQTGSRKQQKLPIVVSSR